MELNEMLKQVKALAKKSHTVPAATTMTYGLREELQSFCENKNMSMRQGLDLAIYFLLCLHAERLEEIVPEAKAEEKTALIETPRSAPKICFTPGCPPFRDADTCPRCGKPPSNYIAKKS